MDNIELKTERLCISPMTDSEISALIERYRDIPELSAAYGEMLAGCTSHPKLRLWYTSWKICLKDGGELGYVGFKGFNSGRPEIGYGIDEEHQGLGYATEAVAALCNWALKMLGVTAVEAETEGDNLASRRVLEKCGFIPTGVMGAEGPRYVLMPKDHI